MTRRFYFSRGRPPDTGTAPPPPPPVYDFVVTPNGNNDDLKIETALGLASSGQTVGILGDCTLTDTINWPTASDGVTLDGGGFTLTWNGSRGTGGNLAGRPILSIPNGANDVIAKGMILTCPATGAPTTAGNTDIGVSIGGARCTLDNVTVERLRGIMATGGGTASRFGTGVYVRSTAEDCTIRDCTIRDCRNLVNTTAQAAGMRGIDIKAVGFQAWGLTVENIYAWDDGECIRIADMPAGPADPYNTGIGDPYYGPANNGSRECIIRDSTFTYGSERGFKIQASKVTLRNLTYTDTHGDGGAADEPLGLRSGLGRGITSRRNLDNVYEGLTFNVSTDRYNILESDEKHLNTIWRNITVNWIVTGEEINTSTPQRTMRLAGNDGGKATVLTDVTFQNVRVTYSAGAAGNMDNEQWEFGSNNGTAEVHQSGTGVTVDNCGLESGTGNHQLWYNSSKFTFNNSGTLASRNDFTSIHPVS